ncbi:MAG: hypothetical protein IJ143_01805, partial [Neisseriaceae bacterium]|nr:hypothetical protein [Neisseriaceae bacterium]
TITAEIFFRLPENIKANALCSQFKNLTTGENIASALRTECKKQGNILSGSLKPLLSLRKRRRVGNSLPTRL